MIKLFQEDDSDLFSLKVFRKQLKEGGYPSVSEFKAIGIKGHTDQSNFLEYTYKGFKLEFYEDDPYWVLYGPEPKVKSTRIEAHGTIASKCTVCEDSEVTWSDNEPPKIPICGGCKEAIVFSKDLLRQFKAIENNGNTILLTIIDISGYKRSNVILKSVTKK